MNVVARATLVEFWTVHPQAETPLSTWYSTVEKATYAGPADVKAAFGANVDFIGDNRVIFDISGNKYRLIARFSYTFKACMIKFIGTHDDYNKVDALTVGR